MRSWLERRWMFKGSTRRTEPEHAWLGIVIASTYCPKPSTCSCRVHCSKRTPSGTVLSHGQSMRWSTFASRFVHVAERRVVSSLHHSHSRTFLIAGEPRRRCVRAVDYRRIHGEQCSNSSSRGSIGHRKPKLLMSMRKSDADIESSSPLGLGVVDVQRQLRYGLRPRP